jgi:predicted nucleic acid-binding protein
VPKTYVFDASALLVLLDKGSGAHRIQQLLEAATGRNTLLLASVVHWGEVFYISWRRHGEQAARDTLADLSQFPIRVLPVDLPQAVKAGSIKAQHGIPYVDSMAVSLAALNDATLVTTDRDFEKLGRHFPILWLTRT